MVAVAAVFGVWLAVRASPWLDWPDLLASFALLGLGASFSSRGSIFDIGSAELSARAAHATVHIAAGAAFIGRPIVGMRRRLAALGPLVRGLLIAVPICALLSALLASADPVFASFFNINLDLGQVAADVFFVGTGGLAMAGLLRLALAEPLDRIDGPAWRLGATEALIVLALLDAVFTAFAIAQVLAASGEATATLRSAGVSYSDYARSGFFQLLWVGGITLVVLILFSRIAGSSKAKQGAAFLILSETAIALTLMIVVVAFRRLSLYEDVYGFTMLRLYSHIFAVWMAVVFVLLGAELLGAWRQRHWFVGATAFTAVTVLLALNFINPEAALVGLNVSHAASTHKIDTDYLSSLSSDATPRLVEAAQEVDPTVRQRVANTACRGPRSYAPSIGAFNWSEAEAAAARRASC